MTDRELEPTAASSSRTVPCTSRAAGHAVHPTRVLLCDRSPDDVWTTVVVMGAVGDVLTVACGAELRRYRNHGAGRLLDLVDTTGVRLLPTDDLLAGMRRAYGEFFVEQTIPGSVYGTSEDVRTIGVPNLLLVRADLPADLTAAVTATLFEAQPALVAVHPEARHLDSRSAITTAPVLLHPGAVEYYRSVKPGVG